MQWIFLFLGLKNNFVTIWEITENIDLYRIEVSCRCVKAVELNVDRQTG